MRDALITPSLEVLSEATKAAEKVLRREEKGILTRASNEVNQQAALKSEIIDREGKIRGDCRAYKRPCSICALAAFVLLWEKVPRKERSWRNPFLYDLERSSAEIRSKELDRKKRKRTVASNYQRNYQIHIVLTSHSLSKFICSWVGFEKYCCFLHSTILRAKLWPFWSIVSLHLVFKSFEDFNCSLPMKDTLDQAYTRRGGAALAGRFR